MHSAGAVAIIPTGDAGLISQVTITAGLNTQIYKNTRYGFSSSAYPCGSIDVSEYEIGNGQVVPTSGLIYNSLNGCEFIDSLSGYTGASATVLGFVDSAELPAATAGNYFNRVIFENLTTAVTTVLNFTAFSFSVNPEVSGVWFTSAVATYDLNLSTGDIVRVTFRRD